MRAAAHRTADPREKLVAIFAATAQDIAGSGYRGCPRAGDPEALADDLLSC